MKKEVLRRILRSLFITCEDGKDEGDNVFCILPRGLYRVIVEEISVRGKLKSSIEELGVGTVSIVKEVEGYFYRVRFTETFEATVVEIEDVNKRDIIGVLL